MLFKKNNDFIAQGTIEYLVIMAIVIVIGLVVVGMLVSMNDSGDITKKNSDLKNRIGTGGISVVEAVLDEDGDVAITFQNVSGETLTIQTLAGETVTGTFLEDVANSRIFTLYLSGLGSSCICESGMRNKECDFELTKSKNINGQLFSEKLFFTINLDCVNNVNGNNFIYEYIDRIAPTITLLSPTHLSTTSNTDLNLEFRVNDISAISDCNVYLDGSLQEQIFSPQKNTTIYSLSSGLTVGTYDFNVICTDVNNNVGNSATNTFSVTTPTTNMTINLIAPSNGATVSGPINFDFNVIDNTYDIDYCELILDGVVNAKLTNITESTTMRFAHPGIANDDYTWDINCINSIGDEEGVSRNLTVYTSLSNENYLFFAGRGSFSNYAIFYFNTPISTEPTFIHNWSFDSIPSSGMILDSNNNLWLSPIHDNLLKEKINSSGDILYSTQFSNDIAVEAIDGYGSIYDSDNGLNETLNKNDFNGNLINTFNIGFPINLVSIDLNKNIWVLENSASTGSIKKLDIRGNVLETYPLSRATDSIIEMNFDLDNNLWLVDYSASELIKLSQTGSILGTYSVLTNPLGVKVNIDNNLWVHNADNIYKYSQTGTPLQTIILSSLSLSDYKMPIENSNKIYFAGGPVRKITKAIAISSDGNIWAPGYEGTTGYLYKISQSGTIFNQYTSGTNEEYRGFGDFSGFGLQYFILGRR
ncbi:MAG: hypothetical protein WC915_05770 [archaeon]|jgi:hypothetical protein